MKIEINTVMITDAVAKAMGESLGRLDLGDLMYDKMEELFEEDKEIKAMLKKALLKKVQRYIDDD